MLDPYNDRLNLACLAVGSTAEHPPTCSDCFTRLNLACLAVGSTSISSGHPSNFFRLNLACLAVGSTVRLYMTKYLSKPPQSSLFGCRFDGEVLKRGEKTVNPPQSSLFGCRFDDLNVIPFAQPYRPPQSSLFGCRFDKGGVMESEWIRCRLNLACLAVGSTGVRGLLREVADPPQSSLFGCRFDNTARRVEK